VQGAQKASTAVAVAIPIIAFGLPVLDTGFSIVRRFVSGRPLFDGDREHIHHKLLERGWSQRRVVLVLYALCAVFGLVALFFVNDAGMRTTGLVLFVVGFAALLIVGSLRYHEVDELKASVRRGFGDRRLRVANNIHVRRASRLMSKAKSLEDIFGALEELLELGEFVYATAHIGREQDAARNEQLLARERTSPALDAAELRDGLIQWTWERGDIDAADIVGSGYFWTLRLPLSTASGGGCGLLNLYRGFGDAGLLLDINYLCDLFQREMSQAVERALNAEAATMNPDWESLSLSASVRH
jgi:UDP-GlcNAc:undecaprenyl-phosphate GlcNAc-1-phosphate transferase